MRSRNASGIVAAVTAAIGLMVAPAAFVAEDAPAGSDLAAEVRVLQEQGVPLEIAVDAATGKVVAYEEIAPRE